ncbi:hypothetical protein CO704_07330 [Cedecea neteri]|uniref:Uncharacterized protein n=1 Tax=Cedecea neteri TaxID=158822 RepID=A0A291DW12_9ENTR|nr:hypothetical protein CO704_07330 [Cedecea neteri]
MIALAKIAGWPPGFTPGKEAKVRSNWQIPAVGTRISAAGFFDPAEQDSSCAAGRGLAAFTGAYYD